VQPDSEYYIYICCISKKWLLRVSKVSKNIAFFSLWLAGFVIIAHLMIPHDHHSDCSVFNKDNECHAGNTAHHDKSPSFPVHCHALNDLTFEKTTTAFFVHSIPICNLFNVTLFDLVISDSNLYCIKIKDSPKPLKDADFLRLSPFRGPPALV